MPTRPANVLLQAFDELFSSPQPVVAAQMKAQADEGQVASSFSSSKSLLRSRLESLQTATETPKASAYAQLIALAVEEQRQSAELAGASSPSTKDVAACVAAVGQAMISIVLAVLSSTDERAYAVVERAAAEAGASAQAAGFRDASVHARLVMAVVRVAGKAAADEVVNAKAAEVGAFRRNDRMPGGTGVDMDGGVTNLSDADARAAAAIHEAEARAAAAVKEAEWKASSAIAAAEAKAVAASTEMNPETAEAVAEAEARAAAAVADAAAKEQAADTAFKEAEAALAAVAVRVHAAKAIDEADARAAAAIDEAERKVADALAKLETNGAKGHITTPLLFTLHPCSSSPCSQSIMRASPVLPYAAHRTTAVDGMGTPACPVPLAPPHGCSEPGILARPLLLAPLEHLADASFVPGKRPASLTALAAGDTSVQQDVSAIAERARRFSEADRRTSSRFQTLREQRTNPKLASLTWLMQTGSMENGEAQPHVSRMTRGTSSTTKAGTQSVTQSSTRRLQ